MSTSPYRFSQRVLFKLAWENMRKNSFRTLASLIGIVLSCGLIFGIIGTTWSLVYSINVSMVEQRGNWHLSVYTNEYEKFEALLKKNASHIDAVNKSIDHGVILNDRQNSADHVLTVQSLFQTLDHDNFKGNITEETLDLTEGRLPEKPGEIVLPYSLHGLHPQQAESSYPQQTSTITADEPINIGTKITLATGRRFSPSDQLLGYFSAYLIAENGSGTLTENIKELSEPRTFTVVGFVDSFRVPAYVSAQEPSFKATPLATYHISLKDIHGSHELTEFVKSIAIEDAAIFETSFNNHALFMSNITPIPAEFTAFMSFAGILSLIVVFAAAVLISNTFITSMNVRIGQFGLLRSLGATRIQLCSIIIYESFLFACLGIPLGLILGAVATQLTFFITEPLWIASATVISTNHLSLVFNPWIFIVPALLTLVLIFLSSSTAASLIWKTSPLQTMRIAQVQASNRKIKRMFKKRAEAAAWFNNTMNKPRGMFAQCFGTIGFLARRNLKLNSSKARTLQGVLVASVLLFLIGTMLSHYTKSIFAAYQTNNSYDFMISISQVHNANESFDIASHTDETIDKLIKSNEISEATVMGELSDTHATFAPEMLNASLEEKLSTQEMQSIWKNNIAHVSIILLEDTMWKELQKHLTGKTELRTAQTQAPYAVIYNRKNLYDASKHTHTSFEPLVSTQKPMIMHVSDYAKTENNEFDVEIVGLINTLPEKFIKNEGECANILTPITVLMPLNQELPANMKSTLSYNGLLKFYGKVAPQTSTSPTLLKARDIILEIPHAHLQQIDNISRNALAIASTLQILRVYLGLLTVILSIIAIINVFNGVTSALILRSKEFAALLSMGMTIQDLLKVIFTEYLTIISMGILYASLATLGLTFWFNQLSQNAIHTDVFFPLDAFLIACAACILTLIAATAVAFHHTKVMNLSENLKSDLQ